MRSRMNIRGKRFKPVDHVFDRTPQQAACGRHRHFVFVAMKLHTKTAPQVRHDYPNLMLLEGKVGGEHGAHLMRHLS